MKNMEKGFGRMDKAVFFEPDNPEVRLIRGINSASVPDMFHRISIAMEDFKHIEDLQQKQELDMTNEFWLPYYYNYGLALFKSKELNAAEEEFIKVIKLDPESDYSKKVHKKLILIRNEL